MSQAERLILLHIGLPFTQADAIQSALAANREALAARGVRPVAFEHEGWPLVFLYARPRKAKAGKPGKGRGKARATARPAPEVKDPRFDRMVGARRRGAEPAAVAAADRALEEALADPLAQTVVISCDLLSEHLRWGELGRLAERLKAAGEVRVIAFLREPGAHAEAAAQLRLREGVPLRQLKRVPPQPGFRKHLKKFIRHFGREALELRIYDRRRVRAGGLVEDFFDAAGLSTEGLDLPKAGRMRRMPRAAVWAIAARNRVVGWRRPVRAMQIPPGLILALADRLSGPGYTIGRDVRREARRRSRKDVVWLGRLMGRAPFPSGRLRDKPVPYTPPAPDEAG
ncbi:hypothetical protein P2H44_05525 [Albimonas sp. CAU 1670]|uniref:hypothetical protein n=1 Tax=Albimonas sp. CAU 1670 TaxID=3032599 RepID=UPI0023DC716E|nr:hypothetical protein [Albimonas sp. CAU 1670]MDF2232006.1 hypothetical protein [Albimonas sp. CAU 1670]